MPATTCGVGRPLILRQPRSLLQSLACVPIAVATLKSEGTRESRRDMERSVVIAAGVTPSVAPVVMTDLDHLGISHIAWVKIARASRGLAQSGHGPDGSSHARWDIPDHFLLFINPITPDQAIEFRIVSISWTAFVTASSSETCAVQAPPSACSWASTHSAHFTPLCLDWENSRSSTII